MLHMLSIPTWFLTLFAADLHWPEMNQAVAVWFGKKLTQKDVLKMSIKDRSKYLCQNPITGVHMFQHRLEAFFYEYLLSNTHPLGHITNYVIKIEFQMRGSPHAHCLLWVKDAPKIDKDPDDVVCAFIDKYITAVIPPVTSENEHHIKLMDSLQKHTHSEYYCKNKCDTHENSGISCSITYMCYIGQCDLINTCFGLLQVWYSPGGSMWKICYLTSKESILTLIGSY